MAQYYDQQTIITNALPKLPQPDEVTIAIDCNNLWDPTNARICPTYLPLVLGIPLLVALTIILSHAVRLLIPHRPIWLRPFVKEHELKDEGFKPAFRRGISLQNVILFVLSLCGIGLQIIPIIRAGDQFQDMFVALTWFAALLLVTILRPKTASKSLFLLYCSISTAQAIVVAQTARIRIPILQLMLGLGSVMTVLFTPMRNPKLPKDEISPLFVTPTFELRSPEDNLSLWQFLSVSWMAPLISLGKQRQLNDEDVWSLSYEFQHRLLHDRFRAVRGSLVGRLVSANCIDLILLGVTGTIDLLSSLAVPVLLQQILQSMENLNAPRSAAITYAILSLIARLISSQLGVFSLWNGRRAYERSRGEMITMLYEKTLSRKIVGINQDAKESASMGKILNLMRNDVYEIAQRFWEFQSLITKPLGLIFSVILLWKIIGWPCLFGILAVIIGQAANAVFARFVIYWERKRRAATDIKLQRVSQFVEAIRHLRWYGWQQAWLVRIMSARQEELRLRVISYLWGVSIQFVNQLASGMFPVATFYAYTALAGKPLRIDIAFPALQVFTILEDNLQEIPGLITALLNALVAVGRIEEFMREPDVDSYLSIESTSNGHATEATIGDTGIFSHSFELKKASFAWPGQSDTVLTDVTVSFPPGLTIVCGEVGAGKTALLEALLGELDQKDGEPFHMRDAVGYCAQRPWLQSMSIRENILFSAPYEEERYKRVLSACALDIDMVNFEHGDRSQIGENGIGLSGGQRARVALARAVYSTAKILLLDDPISALDHQTAEFVMNNCLVGDLMKGRTIVLVTHRTELGHGVAKQILVVSHGVVRLTDLEKPFLDQASNHLTQSTESREEVREPAVEITKFMEDEHRAHGGVKAAVYWCILPHGDDFEFSLNTFREYIKAGKLRWWFVFICILVIFRMADVGQTWFLKEWGEAYTNSSDKVSSRGLFDRFPPPDVNITPWLIGFTSIALIQAVVLLFGHGSILIIVYTSGQKIFLDVMKCVTHATFRFYDVTPVGRLMNRMTSDINTIDGDISSKFQAMAFLSISWVVSIVIIGSATPIFLACAIIFTISFVIIFLHFLPASQSLRRLEMVSLTPLLSNFGALVEGLTTVRAFRAQHRFLDRVIAVTDNFQKMDHFYWSLQAWLGYRFDILSAFSTLLLTIVAIYSDVSPGLTAFVLIACSNFVISTHSLCKTYGQLLMDFTSVERVVELLHLDQEPPGAVSPPAWWPSLASDVVFENATIRYAPHLDPALSQLSLRIKAGSSTAIIGRTGSGKSTLAMALLATVLPESGRILIDNIDIAEVDKQALRERVTFVAQDPVLFPGSMRQNLDPLEEYSDEECEAVLGKIAGRHQWTLETEVEAGGRNLSQGQRQLIGLARTLLRRSPIVILDEATASIDKETAQSIQEVLHQEMKGRTVITIAHRLEAVKNAEYCIVLGKGRVIKQGRAQDILKEESENLVEFEA